MTEVVEEIERNGLIGRIVIDEDTQSPREWDNLGRMLCFHKRYALGDKHEGLKPENFSGWNEVEQYLWGDLDAVVVLPLYLYDHSRLRMKVGSFHGLLPQGHAEFDSGQVGFIYATKEAVLKEYGVKKITAEIKKKVEAVLRAEVETYDKYLSGQVYGYQVVKPQKCGECGNESEEILDSCYGFYDYDLVRTEMMDSLDACAER